MMIELTLQTFALLFFAFIIVFMAGIIAGFRWGSHTHASHTVISHENKRK